MSNEAEDWTVWGDASIPIKDGVTYKEATQYVYDNPDRDDIYIMNSNGDELVYDRAAEKWIAV